ncbi:MAG: aspartate aminotransferase family protein [Planctomycetes bacterium]|nr:aspartate aminotransferase family protein [Planctomycetota bacterium]
MIRNHIIYNAYLEYAFDLLRAEGSRIWTSDGREFIDFTSGWNTTNLGWNHPEVAEAMAAKLKKGTYAPMWAADESQTTYAADLTGALPAGLTAVGRATGGTEANEMAIKTARAFTGRRKILGFQATYHGQSAGTLAIGTPEPMIAGVVPPNPDSIQIPYPETYRTEKSHKDLLKDLARNLEEALSSRQVAAVVTEAGIVTGWGSTSVAPPGYLPLIREVTREFGTLMILDEVGTGFSRCGALFGMQLEGVTPDLVTFAKGITNGGAALGAMVTRADIAEATFARTILLATFGWTPIACAAARKTLEIHRRDKVWEKARKDGAYIMDRLKRDLADHPRVGDIRGLGMELGIDFVADRKTKEPVPEAAEQFVKEAFSRGLHLAYDHQSNVQIMPPLTIDRPTLDEGLDRLVKAARTIV